MASLLDLVDKVKQLISNTSNNVSNFVQPNQLLDRSTGIPSFVANANAAGQTLVGTAESALSQIQPLPYSVRNFFGNQAQNNLNSALNTRQQTGTMGSIDQGFRPALNTALNVAGPAFKTGLTATGGAKMLATPVLSNLASLGIGSLVGGGLNKLLGGSFGEGAVGGALSTPLYTGAGVLGGKLLAPVIGKINPTQMDSIKPYLNILSNPQVSDNTKIAIRTLLLKNGVRNIAGSALEAGTGNALVGVTDKANSLTQRLQNTGQQFLAGAVFGGGTKLAGYGLQGAKFGFDQYGKVPVKVSQAGKTNVFSQPFHPDDMNEMVTFLDYVRGIWKPTDKPLYESTMRDMAAKYGINPERPNAQIAKDFQRVLEKNWDHKNSAPKGWADLKDQTGAINFNPKQMPEASVIKGKPPVEGKINSLLEEARKYKSAEEFRNTFAPEHLGGKYKNLEEASKAFDKIAGGFDTIEETAKRIGISKDFFEKNIDNIPALEKKTGKTFNELKLIADKVGKENGVIRTKNFNDFYNQAHSTPKVGAETSQMQKPPVAPSTQVGGDISQQLPQQLPKEPPLPQTTSPQMPLGKEQQTQLPQVASKISSLNPKESLPYFNTDRLNVSDKAKSSVVQAIEEAKPSIEKLVGEKLSNKEVVARANLTAKTLNRAVNREQTAQWESALLNARQKLAKSAESGVIDKEYLDNLATVKSLGTDIARKLQSFSISADPKEVTSKQAILEAVLKVTGDANKILAKAKGVDFNDFNQATKFYREFVKPTKSEWLDTLRYNSMLSSPNTHINNFSSNAQGSLLITPIQKSVTGMVDAVKSALTGSKREYLVGEGPAYLKGAISNISEAKQRFADVMSGKSNSQQPDIRSIPLSTGGKSAVVERVLNYPMKLLEASDQFFTALAEKGVESGQQYKLAKGITSKVSPADEAAKILFRSQLGENQGSHVLNAIDTFANTLQHLKNVDNPVVKTIAKYTFPFVRTPTNVLKQGLEYSPLGFSTLYGATNKTEQLAKAIMGIGAATGIATLLGSDRLTWAEPTSANQKAAFRASGMQPYAVKIGNNWVSYSKLHPALAFNFALVSALKNAEDNKKLDSSQVDTVLTGLSKWWQFFADQSFVKNIGDFVNTAQGDVEGAARYVSNYPQQLIPFRALMGWVERLTDPYQRKVDPSGSILDKQLQQIATQIPRLAQKIPERLDTFGKPIPNQNRFINAISPARITQEDYVGKQVYDQMIEKSKNTKMLNDLKDQVKKTGQPVKVGNTYLYPDKQFDSTTGQMKDVIRSIDLGKQIPELKLTGNIELDKKLKSAYSSAITSKISDITKLYKLGQISASDAENQIKELQGLKLKSTSKTSKGRKISTRKVGTGKVSYKIAKLKKTPKKKLSPITIASPKKLRVTAIKAPKIKMPTYKSPNIKIAKLKGLGGGIKIA